MIGTKESGIAQAGSNQLRYPSKIGVGVDEPWIRYEIFKFTPKREGSKAGGSGFQNKPVSSDILHTIAMPFDQQIAITNAQKWDPAGELATAGDNFLAGNWGAMIGDKLSSGGTALAQTFNSGAAGGEKLVDKVSLKYEGPEQRSFTLTHTMIPKSAAEEKNIQSIIKMFRWSSAPEFDASSSVSTSYGFPNLFKISWMMGSKPNRNIPHYDISYMSSVAVTFGDDNFSRFESGAPTVYEITLSFTEMEFINKEHIDKNFL